MRHAHFLIVVLLVPSGAGCRRTTDDPVNNTPGWELQPPRLDAAPVAATGKLPGIYPVGSKLPDKDALGGFGPCENFPFDLNGKPWGTKGAVSLVAFPDEPVAYFKHRGIAVRVINRTGDVVSFPACDSRLLLTQEAKDSDGRWHSIESPPISGCGNSFHSVLIKSYQYWQFPARVYTGSIKTTLRFRLDRGEGQVLLSNEFEGAVNAAQFKEPVAR
jgi:hypothetical protein